MGEVSVNFSIVEYLEMEASSLEKLEYYDGEIFAMAGGTLNHNLLSNNVGGSLRQAPLSYYFSELQRYCRKFMAR